ncbi:MAG: hypothetical protein LBK47_01810 [Prevotellaceae bacterium]|nr:hypothetical protein [Prevotellaceae bacterium]
MKSRTLFFIPLIFLCFATNAQTEHYVGVIGGKVVGLGYTLQHKRWSANANAGWLMGFKGGYCSVNGLYGLLAKENNGDWMWLDVGLGAFMQGYGSPTQHQEELAKKLHYNTPAGAQAVSKIGFSSGAFPRWSFGMYISAPLIFDKDASAGKLSMRELYLAYIQLSVQYKI